MTAEDFTDVFAAALAQIRGRPGVWVGPPADEELLRDAEDRLGFALPDDLRSLLGLANGLSIQHGLERILGVGGHEGPDLVAFNDPANWKYAWPRVENLDDTLVYGVGPELYVAGWDRRSGRHVDGPLMLGDLEPGNGLVDLVTKGYPYMASLTEDEDYQPILDAVGPIGPFDAPYPGTGYLVTAEQDPSEVRVMPLEQVLRMSGDLHEDANRLPPRTTVAAPITERDEHGRERWRWVTDKDLPGLAERSGGLLSHITIDGKIPGPDDC